MVTGAAIQDIANFATTCPNHRASVCKQKRGTVSVAIETSEILSEDIVVPCAAAAAPEDIGRSSKRKTTVTIGTVAEFKCSLTWAPGWGLSGASGNAGPQRLRVTNCSVFSKLDVFQ